MRSPEPLRVPDAHAGQGGSGGAAGQHRHPAVILLAIALLALNLRAAVSVVPPLLTRISTDLQLSTAAAGLLGALPAICFAVSGVLAPALVRRRPAEQVALGLVVVFAAAELLRPFAPTGPTFLAATTLTLLAMGSGNVVLPPVVKAHFPARIGAVTSFYVTCLAIGTAVPPLLAVPLADLADAAGHTPGWRLALSSWGAMAAVAALAWVLPARRPRTRPEAGGRPRPAPLPVYRSRVAWGVLLVFAVTSVEFYSVVAWLPRRLVDAGLSEQAAGAQLALVAGVGLPVALVVPQLAARARSPMPVLVGFYLLAVAGLLGLWLAPAWNTAVWGSLFSLGMGGFPMALALIGLRSATPDTAAVLSGFVQGLGYGLAGTGPLLIGVLYSGPDGWTGPFLLLLAWLVLFLVAGVLLGRPGTVDDDLAGRSPGTTAGGGSTPGTSIP